MAVPCSVAPLSTPNYKNPASTVGKASFVKIQVDGGRIGNRKTSEPLITLLLRLLLWILSCRDLWDDAKHHLILPHGRLWGHLRDSFDLCTLVHGCLRASVTFFLVVICSHSETNTLGDYYPERRTWLPSTYFCTFRLYERWRTICLNREGGPMSNHLVTICTSRSPSERTETSLELAFMRKCGLQTWLSNYSQGNTRFVWNQM